MAITSDIDRTVVLCVECQGGAVGAEATLSALKESTGALIEHVDRVLSAARLAGVRVVHAVFEGHLGGRRTGTAPLWRALEKADAANAPGLPAACVVPELLAEGDLVQNRHHGLWPTRGTELLDLLRGFGVETVVLVGVSVNVALTLTAADLQHAGFRIVVPHEAVGGTPPEFVELALRHQLAMLAKVSTVDDVVSAWPVPAAAER